MIEFVNKIEKQYGPWAFGLLAVLVLWHVVVRPQLVGFGEAMRSLHETARLTERTADKLLMLSARMERP